MEKILFSDPAKDSISGYVKGMVFRHPAKDYLEEKGYAVLKA